MIDPAIDVVRRRALQLDFDKNVERLLDLAGDAKLVLIGEASHGTHEFYRVRADMTRAFRRSIRKRLIERGGDIAASTSSARTCRPMDMPQVSGCRGHARTT